VDGAISAYRRFYGVDLRDAEVPEGGFASFDAFFTRTLRAGARPADTTAGAILSPADGRVEDFGPIAREGQVVVKGRPYRLADLFGGDDLAAGLEGGRHALVYLSPADYHRVHAPVSGQVVAARHVPGSLWPVNRIGLAHVPGLFAQNERVAVRQEGPDGPVVTALVGAFVVGGIDLAFVPGFRGNAGPVGRVRDLELPDDLRLARADDLGCFHLGSSVLVAWRTEADFAVRLHQRILVGQALAVPR
jgi:phosphatidylserine decarboxylase